jgi:hypothetical protein
MSYQATGLLKKSGSSFGAGYQQFAWIGIDGDDEVRFV